MDGFSKFLKSLLLIPVIGLVVFLVVLSFCAPLFILWLTIILFKEVYKEVFPKGWKIGTYVVAFIDEGLLLLSILFTCDFLFIPSVVLFGLLFFNCTVASVYAARKDRRKKSRK